MRNIQQEIQEKLDEIERTEHVKILHCVESGSRSWGFPSPDSDYDVRFIYLRERDAYLDLAPPRDVIEWQLDEVLDISGWDVQKLLRLLYKSNPTVFEWNSSPIIYRTAPEWQRISEVIPKYFRVKSGLHHYLSMASGNARAYLQGDAVKLKKYFYVLRPILACRWILDRQTPPPMLFSELMQAELEPEIRPVVDDLLARKQQTSELGAEPPIAPLHAYIDRQLAELKEIAEQTPDRPHPDWDALNKVFLSLFSGIAAR